MSLKSLQETLDPIHCDLHSLSLAARHQCTSDAGGAVFESAPHRLLHDGLRWPL